MVYSKLKRKTVNPTILFTGIFLVLITLLLLVSYASQQKKIGDFRSRADEPNFQPTGTLSCPPQIVSGQTGLFTLTGSDINGNLAAAGLYYTTVGTSYWYRIPDNNACASQDCSPNIPCTGSSCTVQGAWTPITPGTYWVAANYHDAAGAKCTGSPTPSLEYPPCSASGADLCTVSVVANTEPAQRTVNPMPPYQKQKPPAQQIAPQPLPPAPLPPAPLPNPWINSVKNFFGGWLIPGPGVN